jgi:hypothetical protein
MASNFIHKLMHAEIPPPESAWDKIAAELEKSDANSFVHKLRNASVEPPVSVWPKVLGSFDEIKPAGTGGILAKGWFKWSAAAVLVGLVAITALFLFNSSNSSSNKAARNEQPAKQSPSTVQPKQADTQNRKEDNSIVVSDEAAIAEQASAKNRPAPRKKNNTTRVKYAVVESSELPGPVYENDPRVINNVPVSSANYIPAPDHYVVTAPNGERVRISAKFSDAVTSLFGGDNVDYLWKSKFDSWKTKLISNPSFMPAAGNFLDIAELKDLLKEQ